MLGLIVAVAIIGQEPHPGRQPHPDSPEGFAAFVNSKREEMGRPPIEFDRRIAKEALGILKGRPDHFAGPASRLDGRGPAGNVHVAWMSDARTSRILMSPTVTRFGLASLDSIDPETGDLHRDWVFLGR